MSLTAEIITAGYCEHPMGALFWGKSLRLVKFPANVVLIRHPREGLILIDTGFAPRFREVTRQFPEKLYALLVPVHCPPEETARARLQQAGIAADEVRHVILTHFHADHAAGIADFPRATYHFMDRAYNEVVNWSRFKRARKGFLLDLLPADFTARARPLQPGDFRITSPLPGFAPGADIFGDGSLIGIPLPGHAPGHMGLLAATDDRPTFFIGDACWHQTQYTGTEPVTPIVRLIIDNYGAYENTLQLLRQTDTTRLSIVPCHCNQAITSWQTTHPKAA